MPSLRENPQRLQRRPLAASGVVLLLALCLVTVPVHSQDESKTPISQGVTESFRVFVLRDGLLLEPLASDLGVSAVELVGGEIVIDGLTVSDDELEARLGDYASTILRLADLDPEERRALFESSEDAENAGEDAESAGEDAENAGEDADEASVEDDTGAEDSSSARARRSRSSRTSRDRADNRVVVASSLVIEEDEVSRDAVVFGGSLEVRGRVIGDAAAMGGSAVVSGEVDGDLVAIGGSIELLDGAEIRGDVVSVGGSVEQAEGAEVLGQVVQVPFDAGLRFGGDWDWDWDSDHKPWHGWRDHEPWRFTSPFSHAMKLGWSVVGLGILALLACLVLLVAPNAVDRVGSRAADEPWKAGLVGLLTQILFFPLLVIVCLILLVSVIGIPLLILVPFAILALILGAFLGYTAVAHRLGEWLERRFGWSVDNPYFVLLLGIALLQVWSLLAEALDFGWGPLWFFAVMFGIFGSLLIYVAWTVGLGAAILTRFGTPPSGGAAGALLPPDAPSLPPAGGDGPTEASAWDEHFDSEPQPPELPELPETSEPPKPSDDSGKREE